MLRLTHRTYRLSERMADLAVPDITDTVLEKLSKKLLVMYAIMRQSSF